MPCRYDPEPTIIRKQVEVADEPTSLELKAAKARLKQIKNSIKEDLNRADLLTHNLDMLREVILAKVDGKTTPDERMVKARVMKKRKEDLALLQKALVAAIENCKSSKDRKVLEEALYEVDIANVQESFDRQLSFDWLETVLRAQAAKER